MVVIGVWYFISVSPAEASPPVPDAAAARCSTSPSSTAATATSCCRALWSSTKVALVGLAISIVLGMLLAILMSQAKWIERSLFPYAVVLQTIPILALVPLIGFWFGFNFRSRVFVCVIIALFPIVTNTLFGLLSADQGQHDLFTLHDVEPLDAPAGSCSSPRACRRSSPASASPPACR